MPLTIISVCPHSLRMPMRRLSGWLAVMHVAGVAVGAHATLQ